MHEYEPASFRQSFERNQDKKKGGDLERKSASKQKDCGEIKEKQKGKKEKREFFYNKIKICSNENKET